MKVIFLDTGPLGMVTHPRGNEQTRECAKWMSRLLRNGATFVLPEIADYELRRALLLGEKKMGLTRLDSLKSAISYCQITTQAILKAAEFWALARKRGKPTAPDEALDGDVILAAQAAGYKADGREVIIATTNVRHLEDFSNARLWQSIS